MTERYYVAVAGYQRVSAGGSSGADALESLLTAPAPVAAIPEPAQVKAGEE